MLLTRVPNLVSIVVTSFNTAKYLTECLNSLTAQRYKKLEIIVVNDASKDDTASILQRWKKATVSQGLLPKNRIILLNSPRNLGFAGAVTTGMFLAKGEFIAMQDSDDFSHPQRIAKQVQYLKNHPEIGLVGTNYVSFMDGNFHRQIKPTWLQYGKDIRTTYANGGHCVCHGTIMLRGEIFDRLGGPTRRINGAEDYEFIAKCISHDIGVENLPDVLYYYRNRAGQRSKTFFGRKESASDG